MDPEMAARIAAISTALSELRDRPGPVFRGTPLTADEIASYVPGTIRTEAGFTSTSADQGAQVGVRRVAPRGAASRWCGAGRGAGSAGSARVTRRTTGAAPASRIAPGRRPPTRPAWKGSSELAPSRT